MSAVVAVVKKTSYQTTTNLSPGRARFFNHADATTVRKEAFEFFDAQVVTTFVFWKQPRLAFLFEKKVVQCTYENRNNYPPIMQHCL